ncbi:MAG: SLC13 family permease [Bacteroidales bacterium]|nr:SLC13 family permease [Bacteroidales bacterium]
MDASIIIVLIILTATVVLLITELVRIDMVAILCMLALGWAGILEPHEMLSGFSSNAVIVVMAVMIIGHGIARTGLMDRFSIAIIRVAGPKNRTITAFMSLIVGLVSGFIQNIGAAAIFLPGMIDVSRRTNIPASSLIMPAGFAVILGGTLTMVGSGHLILVNDLLLNAGLQPYGLFSVTPLGVLLLASGIAFFYFFGNYVLPRKTSTGKVPSAQEKLIEALQLPSNIWYYSISGLSPLIDQTTEQSGIWKRFNVNIIGTSGEGDVIYAPWRETRFKAGQQLALLGLEDNIKKLAAEFELLAEPPLSRFSRLRNPDESGFAEVIVPPRSEAIGQTIRKFAMRRRFAVEPLRLFSKGEEMRGDFSDHQISIGDTIIVYGLWDNIQEMDKSIDFVVATPFKSERKIHSKTWTAGFGLVLAIALALTGFPIAMAFFTGAISMILLGVLNMQQAYQAIEWKIVFLLAGLIPLGVAMQKTGASMFLAEVIMELVSGSHPLVLILTIGVISTIFSLLISNFGAIVVLAPMVIGMAEIAGLDPRPLVLMAAVCVSNSFILPTQQVNALLMTPGGYRNIDFIKGGMGLTILFLVITVSFFYFILI